MLPDLVASEFDIDNGPGRELAPVTVAAQGLTCRDYRSSNCGKVTRILWDA